MYVLYDLLKTLSTDGLFYFVLVVIPSVIDLVQDAVDLCNGHKDAITQGTIDLDRLVYDHSVLNLTAILNTA
jgi:hypothetical protein